MNRHYGGVASERVNFLCRFIKSDVSQGISQGQWESCNPLTQLELVGKLSLAEKEYKALSNTVVSRLKEQVEEERRQKEEE
jgi:hypothetical protein